MEGQYNKRSPAVKRLMREAQELSEATSQYHAQPLEDNLFEWHFTVRGPSDTDFEGGIYHGRIVLPTEYPMKPPNIIVLTPNGRFETNKKICLSISGHHPESWQPSWSIRTALLAIIGFMPTEGHGTIGSLDYPSDERKALARRSVSFCCNECGGIAALLKSEDEEEAGAAAARKKAEDEMKEIVKNVSFTKGEEKTSEKDKESSKDEKKSDKAKAPPDDGLTDEVRERKRLSLAAQQKFRERLLLRQGKPTGAKGAANRPSPSPARAAQPANQRTPARQQQQARARQHQLADDDRTTMYDYLIVVLLVAIAAIVYRRFALVSADGSDDPAAAPLT